MLPALGPARLPHFVLHWRCLTASLVGATAGAGSGSGFLRKPEALHRRVRRERHWSSGGRWWAGCEASPCCCVYACRGEEWPPIRVAVDIVGGSFRRRSQNGSPAAGGNALWQACHRCRTRGCCIIWSVRSVAVGSGASWWPEPVVDNFGGMTAHLQRRRDWIVLAPAANPFLSPPARLPLHFHCHDP
jgi:hypothetical protein